MADLPVALPWVTETIMVTSNDVGALRNNASSICPLLSLTLYTDWLKDTVASEIW